MSRVTFDYSKAKTFISEHEIVSMKKIAENAKAELLGREGEIGRASCRERV